MRLQGLVDRQTVEDVAAGGVDVDGHGRRVDLPQVVGEALRGVTEVADLIIAVDRGRLGRARLVFDAVPVGPGGLQPGHRRLKRFG